MRPLNSCALVIKVVVTCPVVALGLNKRAGVFGVEAFGFAYNEQFKPQAAFHGMLGKFAHPPGVVLLLEACLADDDVQKVAHKQGLVALNAAHAREVVCFRHPGAEV